MRAPITDKHLLELMWERFPEIMKRGIEQPAQQQEWIETACALIKAADDAAADSDYMLDSNDCIKVLRGQWRGR